jgi:enolase
MPEPMEPIVNVKLSVRHADGAVSTQHWHVQPEKADELRRSLGAPAAETLIDSAAMALLHEETERSAVTGFVIRPDGDCGRHGEAVA